MNKLELNKEIITLIKFRLEEIQLYRALSIKYNCFKQYLECPEIYGLEHEYYYESYLQCLDDLKGIDDELIKLIKKSPSFFINFYYLACNEEPFNSDDSYKILTKMDDKTAYKIIDLITKIYEPVNHHSL
jgi:hypothetical protein